MTDALVLTNVAKAFGPIRVLEDINLRVGRTERHALIGPNGAGKSTLFNLISGRFRPSAGSIMLEGQRIDGKKPHRLNRAGLSRSFQITQVFNNMTVADNVRLGVMGRHGQRWSLFRRGAAWKSIEAETEALLADARLEAYRDALASSLAYSQLRALEICMTLATGPAIILLDEPTAGMSREESAHTSALMLRMARGRGLLVVEHDMDVVFHVADRISVLVNGRILVTGTPEEVRRDPRVREAYLGEAQA